MKNVVAVIHINHAELHFSVKTFTSSIGQTAVQKIHIIIVQKHHRDTKEARKIPERGRDGGALQRKETVRTLRYR